MISTLVDKEDIVRYVDTAEKNLQTILTEVENTLDSGGIPSLSSVTALAASIETLASVSGALDTTTEVNIALAKKMNIIAKASLPILQKCETSKTQEKAMDNCFDLIGRLNQNQTNGGTTVADITFDVVSATYTVTVERLEETLRLTFLIQSITTINNYV